jgi:hypothetical protein
MKKLVRNTYLPLLMFCLFLIHPFVFARSRSGTAPVIKTASANTGNLVRGTANFGSAELYDSLQLDTFGLSRQAFLEGVKGYDYLRSEGKLNNDNVLSIVDFSLPSGVKRLFVLDMENFRVLYNTYVAHGRNSGGEYAKHFSNSPRSNMSSLGFFITKGTYYGEHGLSLKLEGEERGINDNAAARAIVIHCADYVSEKMVKALGYIGRSLGCPALPEKYSKPIIETIKDGSCFFVYSPSPKYRSRSQLLHAGS